MLWNVAATMPIMMSSVPAADGHLVGYEVRKPADHAESGTIVVFVPALGVPL